MVSQMDAERRHLRVNSTILMVETFRKWRVAAFRQPVIETMSSNLR